MATRNLALDRSDGEALDLPRSQVGSAPQHLLMTLFGDYWWQRTDPLPSAALVALLGEFGITPVSGRAALSRLARRGLLTMTRMGRHSYYGVAESAAERLTAGARRTFAFATRPQGWDRSWTLVAYMLRESQRDLRYTVRATLRYLGFAPLYDAVWVSPRPVAAECAAALADLGVRTATVLRTDDPADLGGRSPIEAWDLTELSKSYLDFIDRNQELRLRAHDGAVAPAEALVARTRVMDDWRVFPSRDPELPEELLPSDWPRARAYQVFTEVYDALGPIAELRVRQVLGQFDPGLAGQIHHHRATGWVGDEPYPGAASHRASH